MADLYPLPTKGKLIGTPGQGTHAKAFNVKGGSDNWESENAIDISTPTGTPVLAVADGTIGPQIGAQGGGRFAGLRVHLVTSGNEFFYAHLSKLTVKAGETVTAGQIIGYSGSADGVQHLHIASKVGNPQDIFQTASTAPRTPQKPEEPPAVAAQATPSAVVDATQPSPYVADSSVDGPPSPSETHPLLLAPGSGSVADAATGGGQYVSRLWSLISSQPDASPDTLAYVQNVAAGTGG